VFGFFFSFSLSRKEGEGDVSPQKELFFRAKRPIFFPFPLHRKLTPSEEDNEVLLFFPLESVFACGADDSFSSFLFDAAALLFLGYESASPLSCGDRFQGAVRKDAPLPLFLMAPFFSSWKPAKARCFPPPFLFFRWRPAALSHLVLRLLLEGRCAVRALSEIFFLFFSLPWISSLPQPVPRAAYFRPFFFFFCLFGSCLCAGPRSR